MRLITDNPTSPDKPVLILGKNTSTNKQVLTQDGQRLMVQVESLEKVKNYLHSTNAAGLIITRDIQDFTHHDLSDLIHILGPTRFLLLWPSDEVLDRFIGHVLAPGEIGDTKSYHDEELQARIAKLEAKNASLEATIRTLVAALSQYDPWPEVYAGDENAWDLIMQNVPIADQDQEEFNQSYDENSGDEDDIDDG